MYHLWVLNVDGSQYYESEHSAVIRAMYAPTTAQHKLVSPCCHAATFHHITSEYCYCLKCGEEISGNRRFDRPVDYRVTYWN